MHYVPLVGQFTKKGMIKYITNYCNCCDLVITPTDVIRDLIKERGVTAPVLAIPTGIYPERFQNGDPTFLEEKFGIPREKKVLLFVGRIGKEKNLAFLLRAFSYIATQEKDAVLVMVGSGPEEGTVRLLAEDLGLKER